MKHHPVNRLERRIVDEKKKYQKERPNAVWRRRKVQEKEDAGIVDDSPRLP